MMKSLNNLLITETQVAFAKERQYTIDVINQIYSEWKKISRRKNAVNMITTSVNKLATIDESMIDHIHDAARIKLTIILMRCMDVPPHKPLSSKEKTYKKLYRLIQKLQFDEPNTETGGSLGEVIMTRLSACHYYNSDGKVFVAYEPKMPKSYLHYMFGEDIPAKTYKMQALTLPEKFETLVGILEINQKKALEACECEENRG